MLFDDAVVGHYCLPETSYVQYHPASILNFKEFLLKSQRYSKFSSTDDVMPHSERDALTFDILMQLICLLISGTVAVLMAWIMIRQQVSY